MVHKNYGEGTRTVTLTAPEDDANSDIQIATFEEAFGEHSEWHGRGRARRQARRLQRIENRGARQAARQANRQARLDARETRKDERHQRKDARKDADSAAADQANAPTDSSSTSPTDSGATSGAPDGAPDNSGGGGGAVADNSQLDTGGGSPDQSQDSGGGDQSQGDGGGSSGGGGKRHRGGGGGAPQGGGDDNSGQDSGDNSQGGGDESGGGDVDGDNGSDNTDADLPEDESQGAFDAAPYNPHLTFGNVYGNEDDMEFSEAEGKKIAVHPSLQALADRVAWNKKMIQKKERRIQQIEAERKTIATKGGANAKQQIKELMEMINKLRLEIGEHEQRAQELEAQMHGMAGEEHPHIPLAKKYAEEKIQRHIEKVRERKEGEKTKQHLRREEFDDRHPETVVDKKATLVHKGLRPVFNTNKISVPPLPEQKSQHFDASDGYDTTQTRIVELKSNADGATHNSHLLRNVLIIGAVAGLVWYAHKHKLFESK